MARWYGANFPFVGGNENVLSRQEDGRLIKNDLLQLLLTIPGERVARPYFGTPLRSFTFEDMSPQSIARLKSGISSSIAINEPRVQINRLDLSAKPDQNYLEILLVVSMVDNPRIQLTINFDYSG